jgi:hypothetical protein
MRAYTMIVTPTQHSFLFLYRICCSALGCPLSLELCLQNRYLSAVFFGRDNGLFQKISRRVKALLIPVWFG